MNSPPNPAPPLDFIAEAGLATTSAQPAKLTLLAAESEPFPWHPQALELITAHLLHLGAFRAAARINQPSPPTPSTASQPEPWPYSHAILFTGHMIDAPNRPSPRFPAAAEPAARNAILNSLRDLQNTHPGSLIGLAGGASGGDLLFHECCFDLGIPTLLRLTLPAPGFLEASVAPAGPAWVARFHTLLNRLAPDRIQVLGPSTSLPRWLAPRAGYDVWQRTNLWLVHEAILLAPGRSLVALWDGKPGDGPGGTQHLLQAAPDLGIAIASVISTTTLTR